MGQGFLLYYYYYLVLELIVDLLTFLFCKVGVLAKQDNEPLSHIISCLYTHLSNLARSSNIFLLE